MNTMVFKVQSKILISNWAWLAKLGCCFIYNEISCWTIRIWYTEWLRRIMNYLVPSWQIKVVWLTDRWIDLLIDWLINWLSNQLVHSPVSCFHFFTSLRPISRSVADRVHALSTWPYIFIFLWNHMPQNGARNTGQDGYIVWRHFFLSG